MRIHWSWSITARLFGALAIIAACVVLYSKPAHGDGTTRGISVDEAKGVCADWQKVVAANPGKGLENFTDRNAPDSGLSTVQRNPGQRTRTPQLKNVDKGPKLADQCNQPEAPITAINTICLALESGQVGDAQTQYFQQKTWSAGTKNACDSLCDYDFANCDQTAPVKVGSAPVEAQAQVKKEINVAGIVYLRNGLLFYALITCVGGMFVAAAMWAIGSKNQNHGAELAGKNGFIVCITASFLLGFGPHWVDYLDKTAKTPALDPAGATSGVNQVPAVGKEGDVQTKTPAAPG